MKSRGVGKGWFAIAVYASTYSAGGKYKLLPTYPRFEEWVKIIREVGGDLDELDGKKS